MSTAIRIVYTEFQSTKATQGKLRLVSLDEFRQQADLSYATKEAQPLYVPDILPGSDRSSGVESEAAASIFLDFDKPKLEPELIARKLKGMGAAFALYHTFSHAPEKPRYRVVLPLEKPISLEARQALIARIEAALPGVAPESYQAKRGYFVGRNGHAAPACIIYKGKPAADVRWPKAAGAPGKLRGHPAQLAMDLVVKLGRKLQDGDGRWAAVEHLATRVSARHYSAEMSRSMLKEMVAKCFDAREVETKDLARWEARIAYWEKRDFKKSVMADKATRAPVNYGELPVTFTAEQLLAMDLPATEWLVEGLLPPGLALMAAPPRTGKTMIALDLAMSVAAGVPFLNHFKTRRAQVIYYDLESGHHLLQERVLPLARARQLKPADLGMLSFSLVSERGEKAILQLRADLEANPEVKLIVLDIFIKVRGDPEPFQSVYQFEYESAQQFQQLCHENPGLCILIVHHTNKQSPTTAANWQTLISGSYGLVGATHTNWLLMQPVKQGLSGEDAELMKQYLVLHASGKRVQDHSTTLVKTGTGVTWEVSNKNPEQVRAGRVQREILAVLESDKARKWTAKEVAEALGKNVNTTKEMMRRMGQDGMIHSTGSGYNWQSPKKH